MNCDIWIPKTHKNLVHFRGVLNDVICDPWEIWDYADNMSQRDFMDKARSLGLDEEKFCIMAYRECSEKYLIIDYGLRMQFYIPDVLEWDLSIYEEGGLKKGRKSDMKKEIVGQESITKELGKILDIFNVSEGKIRPHFILTGESGSGKSHIIKSLCKQKEIGVLEINAAQITKEGTAGNSLSKALSPIINMKSKKIVVFVDEFDKLFISTNSNSSVAHEVTVGVQNEFLKVLESHSTSVYGDYGRYIEVDISKTLFVFAGAFNNEEKMTLDKLRNFGVKTEFLGRVGLIYNTKRLSLEDLYLILENSELLENYLKIFVGVGKYEVVSKIKEFLEKNYDNNTIGARIVNTLINQYFIKGGDLSVEDVEEVTFQKQLQLN